MPSISVDIRDLLDKNNHPVPSVRRRALWVARMIEYGGPLAPGEARETLIECTTRPKRRPCHGLLWVTKLDDGRIQAWCESCDQLRVFVQGWEETEWADGPMEPVPLHELAEPQSR